MKSKISEYGIEKINLEEFGALELKEFISQLKEKNVEIVGIILLEKGEEFANFILKELKLDLYWDIVYAEGLSGLITEEKKELNFGEYRYLVAFSEKDGKDSVGWFSVYKNLENISKELKLMDE